MQILFKDTFEETATIFEHIFEFSKSTFWKRKSLPYTPLSDTTQYVGGGETNFGRRRM